MQLLKECIFVGLGGFSGAVLRYLLTLIPVKSDFPLMTFIVNISGAVLIGFIVGAAGVIPNVSQSLVLFAKTGVCGGYTTFSTFALESVNLFKNQHRLLGICYIVLSVVVCFLGVILGQYLAKLIFNTNIKL
ncbi:MAG: fluoride efflux transporter CrcB [bacterium]|nr:fluoride efflux transporter CrcB [bacterium]MDD6225302.1 fluoride efflux transporter CrcB [bacterium]MDY3861124.1 fluoride efflux transporter CrcB [Ruminococcus sp.]